MPNRRTVSVTNADSTDCDLESTTDVPADIRFGMHAEVQHRTDTVEDIMSYFRGFLQFVTKSWWHFIAVVTAFLFASSMLKSLVAQPMIGSAPDLLKVAALSRSFEPLIVYSERGIAAVQELQETGIAVWDLSESVKHSNMSSAPILVSEMDGLSESLKILAIEMTRFFANVNGDVDR